ncbi:uncharacterized protein I206_101788 [Kwoniella pini CBS 10737]|uniref:Chromosome segregation in meiosis protein n=1 Tax=Kwoniella pini CBS 10737 TaxID=1296096 RepID=A0A1B9HVP8_9TREE|nr:uncharacterized protein I206_06240 [Kwoniella pini CBS 10737]OCF47344.1 hypothetical protein I206_06240 [Kwoniella pini CBS 10737]
MSGLDDLFNSPVKAPPPRSPIRSRSASPISPSRPAVEIYNENPLFFSPGGPSEFGSPSRPRPRQRSVSPTLSTHPPAGQSRNIPAPEDARYRTHQQGDFEDPFAALHAANNGDDDEQEGGKKRRVMAKVDADRLTSDRGIPALCRAAKKFKVKGKGYESQDLTNLLNMYQMWAHGMFPKGDFQHTINRVEVICRSKRMESALKGYREAFYPPPRSPSPPPVSDRGITPPTASQEIEVPERAEPLFYSRPPQDDAMDADLEEMMALEEMERGISTTEAVHLSGTAGKQLSGLAAHGSDVTVNEDIDEWEGLYN